jgi:hypothetical protein
MTGRDYVIEMLGRTLAERDQQVARLEAEVQQLRQEAAQSKGD